MTQNKKDEKISKSDSGIKFCLRSKFHLKTLSQNVSKQKWYGPDLITNSLVDHYREVANLYISSERCKSFIEEECRWRYLFRTIIELSLLAKVPMGEYVV